MFVILFRLVIFALIFFLIYATIKYITNPKRKLAVAHEKKDFYMWDDYENVRKNFLVTYEGVLFEGEKYLGTTTQAFDVVSIVLWVKDTDKLQGLEKSDFLNIEAEVKRRYPSAEIGWKSPIREFLKKP
ncbi:hypothetical protein [Calidifontibacillus oryziterrae]|uniref:hypothetical protein n=1 Tax=Calidifontibacillus oryziterrae TaxID=1191699 RepID=UPI0002EAF515|nr:hypothetical protein [Calidifontibacillus oryziterrae]